MSNQTNLSQTSTSTSSNPTPTPGASAAPFHAVNWFEIPTRQLDKAVLFYEAVFGRALRRETFGGMPMAVFPSNCPPGSYAVAGALVTVPYMTPGPNGSVVYLDCPDGVRAAVTRAKAAGAVVLMDTMSIGEHGWIAMIDDLEGNRIGLHAMKA